MGLVRVRKLYLRLRGKRAAVLGIVEQSGEQQRRSIFRQTRGRGILQATCLEHAYQPAPILYLLMKIPCVINFPSWMSRVRIPSPAFFGKLLGFNIVQRESFKLRTVTGSLVCRPDTNLRSKPATVFFFVRGCITTGWLRLLESPPQLHSRAGQFFNPGFFERSLL